MVVVRPSMSNPVLRSIGGRGDDSGVGEYVTGQIGTDRSGREPHPSQAGVPAGRHRDPPAAGPTTEVAMKIEITYCVQ